MMSGVSGLSKRCGVAVLATALLLPLLTGCSTTEVAEVLLSKDPEAAAKAIAKQREQQYRSDPVALYRDAQSVRVDLDRLLSLLEDAIGARWGREEVVVPSRKRYVKYTQNYRSRAVVDFDAGLVTIETLEPGRESLHEAIVTTLLTPDDPRSVDMYSSTPVRLEGEPYLYGLVVDHRGRPVGDPRSAEAFADHLIAERRRERDVKSAQGLVRAQYVTVPMVSDHLQRSARRYRPAVMRYAREFEVSPSLVFAVMETESSFNPYAVSSAPAYGLMQLVPSSGGRDAYRRVHGRDGIPGRDMLFDPERNIELGTAYLSLVDQRYLGAIQDPVSREYCVIAAYNGGAGSVLKLFHADRARAVDVINGLSSNEVYRRLERQHPRAETRRYLVKVLDARRSYVNL